MIIWELHLSGLFFWVSQNWEKFDLFYHKQIQITHEKCPHSDFWFRFNDHCYLAACPSLESFWPKIPSKYYFAHRCSEILQLSRINLNSFFFFQKNLQEEIDALESRVASIQRVLADLKVQLYAKFGSNINLEADES